MIGKTEAEYFLEFAAVSIISMEQTPLPLVAAALRLRPLCGDNTCEFIIIDISYYKLNN